MKIVKIIVIALTAVVIAADLCILHQESDKLKKLKREHKKIVKDFQEFNEEVVPIRAVAQNIKTLEILVEPQEQQESQEQQEPQEQLQEYVEDPVFHDDPADMPTDGGETTTDDQDADIML